MAPTYFIPGAACGPEVWDPLIALLAVSPRRVAFPGFAGTPPGPPPPLADQLAAEPSPVVLVAHSLGCFTAYRLAAALPDRVAALVAIDGPPSLGHFVMPGLDDAARRAQARARAGAFAHAPDWRAQIAAQLETMVAPEHHAALVAHALRSDPAAVGAALYQAWTHDLRPLLPQIRAEVIAIVPTGGLPAPARAARIAAHRAQLDGLARRDLVVMDHARHFAMLDDPAGVAVHVQRALARCADRS